MKSTDKEIQIASILARLKCLISRCTNPANVAINTTAAHQGCHTIGNRKNKRSRPNQRRAEGFVVAESFPSAESFLIFRLTS